MDCEDAGMQNDFYIERTINILQSGDKNNKICVLKSLKSYMSECDEGKLIDLYEQIDTTLLRLLQDPNEGVREYSITYLRQFLIEKLPNNKLYLKNLIPILFSRLCSDKNKEGSEEMKLYYSHFISALIIKYESDVIPYIEELVMMTIVLFPELAPELKKSGNTCCKALFNTIPAEAFKYTKKFCAPLVANLGHQHWRVRVSTIEALEVLMLKGDNKCVPDVVNPIRRCVFDDIEHVRMAVTKLAGHWMVDLLDRYSFFSHLLPIILTSISDESEQIRKHAKSIWEKAGQQFLKENENDYKDRIDYENESLDHYPEGVQRPDLGCRIIVEQEGNKFLLALVNEIGDWNERVRIMSSTLLYQYVLHAESSLTQSLHKIINGTCKAAMDYETPKVMENVALAARYMGYFVPPNVYCELIISHMKEANAGELRIATGLIQGSKGDELRPFLPKVASLFNTTTFEDNEHTALLELISSIFITCGINSFDIGDQIWASLISTAGLTEKFATQQRALELLEEFVKLGGGDKKSVFKKHCNPLLNSLLDVVWSAHCHQQFILTSIINYAGEIVEDNLELITSILREAMDQENDPEVILKITMAINILLSNQEITLPSDTTAISFIKIVLQDIIFIHLKWHPGRTAEAIRTVACTCLYMCLLKVINKINSITEDSDQKPDNEEGFVECQSFHFEKIIPMVVSLVEDAAPKTRLLSLNCVQLLSATSEAHETEQFYNLVTCVIKRLEDSDKQVRLLALESIKKLYEEHIKKDKERNYINKGLLEFVYSTLLIHLDDQQTNFGETVLDCLTSIGRIDPELLRRKCHVDKFRNKKICENLIEHLQIHLTES